MPIGLLALIGLIGGAVVLSAKENSDVKSGFKDSNVFTGQNKLDIQQRVTKTADGTYKDSYGNAYQRLNDGSLVAIPNYRF